MKHCIDCGVLKDLGEFHAHKYSKDKHKSYCKSCSRIRTRTWQINNKEKCAESSREYRKAFPEKFRKSNQKTKLKANYNLTLEDYDRMLKEQDFVCAICGNPESVNKNGRTYDLCVDHNHETGEVRGLLCRNCNSGIGLLKDNSETLVKALNYLIKWEKI